MIKAVIFDCFGVFYPDPVFAYMRDSSTPPMKAEALHSLDKQAAVGALDKAGFVKQAAPIVGLPEEETEARFFQGTERNEQLVAYLQELRAHYKVAMLSNIGGDMMDGFFTLEQRQQLFDVVILSGDVKMAKPDRAIFELACERLGVALEEAAMIDDMLSTCEVVRSFGMDSIWYQNFEQFNRDLAAIIQ